MSLGRSDHFIFLNLLLRDVFQARTSAGWRLSFVRLIQHDRLNVSQLTKSIFKQDELLEMLPVKL